MHRRHATPNVLHGLTNDPKKEGNLSKTTGPLFLENNRYFVQAYFIGI